MKIEQIYTGCLAEAAYYIESKGEVVIIDPLREVQPYIDRANKDHAKIKFVLETHFHADFVSGHIDLAKKTGATIVYGPNAETGFDAHIAKDGEILKVGDISIKVVHTPGHTMESTSYLLLDENQKEHCIFTGDTLFIGDVGRPDLAVKSDLSQEDLAGHLYESIYHKILPLADDVIIYPGHGAGSACGKNMSKETFSTLGNQRKYNYALQCKTKEEFIEKVTTGLTPPPQYFPKNVMMNKKGYDSMDDIYEKGLKALTPDEFEEMANELHAMVLDTRSISSFGKSHIPNSIFIGLDGQFAPWVGALITDLKQPVLFIADEGKEEEVVTRLARVGYDHTLGYLKGELPAWKQAGKEIDVIPSITAKEFEKQYTRHTFDIIDVRRPSEYEAQHIIDAKNEPLDYINEWMNLLNRDKTYYIHCAGGYRSMITASILKSRGWHNLVNIGDGFSALEKTTIPMTEFICSNPVK